MNTWRSRTGAFVALKSPIEGLSPEHMNELFATASKLVGGVIEELEDALITDLAAILETSGVVSRWNDAGITGRELAQHLFAASHGIKHYATTATGYRDRMRVAVQIVCRERGSPGDTPAKPTSGAPNLFHWVPCGGGGSSASSPLLNDVTASIRRGDSHPAHRRSQFTQ